MSTIGFIGTGIMGRHMAKHLQDGGHDLLFCPHRNPTPDELLAAGGRDCASRRELTERADVIIMVVPDTPQVAGASITATMSCAGFPMAPPTLPDRCCW